MLPVEPNVICYQLRKKLAMYTVWKNEKTTNPLDKKPKMVVPKSLSKARGYSSAGRALEWHSRGQRFDPA